MRTLVTGGTGFIGSRVVRLLLENGHSVRLFVRTAGFSQPFRQDVDISIGDLEDPASLARALAGIDLFYHIGEIRNTSRVAAEKNVLLMEETLGQAKVQGVRRIIFVSSITVSGIPSVLPANEETPPRIVLNDQYTSYKRRCENLLAAMPGDPEFVIIRPAPVYGSGSRYIGGLIEMLRKFGPLGILFPGNAKNLAALIHADDLARAIYTAGVEPAAAGRVFVLTDGLRHSWREFLEEVADRLGIKVRIISVPPALLKMAALPLDLISGVVGLNMDPVSYVTYFSEDLYFDNAAARDVLHWQPLYSLAEGVNEMISSVNK